MQRVTRASAVSEKPPLPDAEGDGGFFHPGDPATGTPATTPGAEWFNRVQEELVNVVTQLGGLALDGALDGQVASAISSAIFNAINGQNLGTAALRDVGVESGQVPEVLVETGELDPSIIPSSSTEILRKQILLNSLLDAMNEAADLRVIDAIADSYVDESLIDTGASSNYTHDAVNALISNGGAAALGTWDNTVNGAYNMSNYHTGVRFYMPGSGTVNSIRVYKGTVSNAGAHLVDLYNDNDGQPGSLLASADGGTGLGGGTGEKTATWSAPPIISEGYYWIVMPDNATGSPSESFHEVADDLSIVTCRIADSNPVTALDIATNAQGADIRIEIKIETSENMIVISSANEAALEPSTGYLMVLVEQIDAITYDTDLLLDLSKDGGVTWETLETSVINQSAQGYDVVYGSISFVTSGDQTMRYRLRSLNSKQLKVHGAIMDAEG